MAKERFCIKQHLVNEEIKFDSVRIIGEGVDEVLSISAALKQAESNDVDLVLMSDKSKTPICKLMNYKKFIYEQQKKEKQSKKSTQQLKEVRFGNHIAANDLAIKAKTIDRILKEGDKVKVSIIYKGREARFVSDGVKVLNGLIENIKEIHTIDKKPQIEGNKVYMIISPKRV